MSTQEPVLTSPVDNVIDQISVAMHQWSEEQVETIGTKVRQRLDQHRDEVLMKLMGFDKDYAGRWQIDHCNGRGGNSNISDFLKTTQEANVKEWLSQIKLPVMSPSFKRDIEKQLQSMYQHEIQNMIYAMAKARANRDLEELLTTILPATLVDRHLQMQELINVTP